MKTRTVFITSFFGLIARNILATDVLKTLGRQPNLRIIILTPQEKKELYEQQFRAANIIVEGVEARLPSRLEKILSSVFLNSSDTTARRIHRLIERKRYDRHLSSGYHWLLAKLGRLRLIRYCLRWVDYQLMSKNRFRNYFEKYRPNLVFATDIFEPNDVAVMREARKRGIFVLGMVRSWDNITSKGLNRIVPDKLIVNSEKIKEEAMRYNDVRPEAIFVVGIPHYDRYVTDRRTSREELFRKLQLDTHKKTVFFAPPSDIYARNDPITEKVVGALTGLDVQVLLRLYLVGQVNLGNIKPMPNKISIDVPGSGEDFMRADLTTGDAHLADLLYHSDVVVAFASTLAIDAVVFNKPIVFIGFDGQPNRPYWQSLRRFYDYDHQQSILKTGGVKLAKNTEELIEYVKHYLADSKLDEDGRKRIIQERCWKLDGKSGERLAKIILQELGVSNKV